MRGCFHGAVRIVAILAAAAALAAVLAPSGGAGGRVPAGLPGGWTMVSRGGSGGTVWEGQIPNQFAGWDHRLSAIYLPPNYDPARSYPVVYLLHGMRGHPSSYVDGLRIADVADSVIRSGQALPFIAVMPVAGPVVNPDSGEWAGIWESYVVRDVVPWVDAHLSTIATPAGRALEGLCAGGFGAIDIGLRHPGMFGTLGSWEGYFAPVFSDGPFVGATATDLAAHNPTLLVRSEAAGLRRTGVRFYISVGGNHGRVLRAWSLQFARELASLHLPHELWLLPTSERGHFWSATMPSALTHAAAAFKPQ
jgi:enterochelin esterase-like enzyme